MALWLRYYFININISVLYPAINIFFSSIIINKMLDFAVTSTDAFKLNFNKDLASTFIDILNLSFNEIKHPDNVSY